jgi:hypothetical protein
MNLVEIKRKESLWRKIIESNIILLRDQMIFFKSFVKILTDGAARKLVFADFTSVLLVVQSFSSALAFQTFHSFTTFYEKNLFPFTYRNTSSHPFFIHE